MKLTTHHNLVLKLRNNGIIPPLLPCTLMAYQGTALTVQLARRTYVTFVVLMDVIWRIFFWDVTPFSLVDRYHRFEGTCCLCIQGKRQDRRRWKRRCLCNTGISLHNDAAAHSTRQYSCLNERAIKNFFVEVGLRIRSSTVHNQPVFKSGKDCRSIRLKPHLLLLLRLWSHCNVSAGRMISCFRCACRETILPTR
jgi:hypothetical protein